MMRFDRLSMLLAVVFAAALLMTGCGSDGDDAPDGAALPKDFPTGQVPLVDGTVLTADGTRADGWSVTVQGGRDSGNVLENAVTSLTDAGFTESQRSSDGGQKVVILSAEKAGATYWVQVGTAAGAAGGGASVFYQISVD
ncbi:hypothetical protein [Gordonia hankookensis]|uniref:Lipoprotein n=1 Tax=Gordonia hankookensis TaxID=589403 RepID=A0ABR7WAR4_9ACTN|nr:hypothetical protein [Gordonia hankookensis]MBD1319848.1 hypothetical protein [Gordonia hankookensis]NDZ95035.1 hypothetical protein [Streptomyces sp. SID11726]NEB24163.1 hypothetical protein [Streptomyces sp. SID6673]